MRRNIGEKMGEETVSDECLAALRAASEVLGEKCKFTPPSTNTQSNKTNEHGSWEEQIRFLEEDTPRGICYATIGTIGALINTLHFTEEKHEKYNFIDKGGMVITVIKSELMNGGTYKCTGNVSFYIKSKGFVDYMFQKLIRQKPKEVKETPETTIIVMPEELPPAEELEIYRTAIDLEGLGKEWKEAGKQTSKYLKIVNEDPLIHDKKIKVIDFNIIGVMLRFREDTEKTEADVEVSIDATVVLR